MPKKSRPPKRGRPVREDIDRDLIKKLAMIGYSHQEIAARVGCCRETPERRFRHQASPLAGRTVAITNAGLICLLPTKELLQLRDCCYDRGPHSPRYRDASGEEIRGLTRPIGGGLRLLPSARQRAADAAPEAN